MDGLTREDIVVQKNKYGFARATAVKIGAWDKKNKKFIPVKWLPDINSPVYLKQAVDHELDAFSVGHFPKTNYNVHVENINELVTHNTAILGILGIGKSMLSIELVERLIANKTKVIVVDLTDQYANLLPEFIDEEWSTESLNKIQEAGKKDADQFQDSPSEGGSVNYLSEAIENDIYDFIHNEPTHPLKIYNPTQFFATKQLTDPRSYQEDGVWHRAASLWQLTPVEITSIITESTLKNLQNEMSDQARVCLVFEEVHSLVPEWSNAAEEGDKSATN
ncbi:MAG: helicase HerA domain-containing protein [Balneolaceae bacterium]